MITLTPDLMDALAAEYALGTQTALVRNRMGKLIQQHPELALRVDFWQGKLNEMSELARPVPVPPWVWRNRKHLAACQSRKNRLVAEPPAVALDGSYRSGGCLVSCHVSHR